MRTTTVLAALLLSAVSATAEMATLGDLHFDRAMLRATPPNAPVGAGYLTIANMGDGDDVLVSATIAGEVAAEVQLQEMAMSDGVMTMNAVAGGIPVPAGKTVTLASGGYHLMIMGLAQPLTAGGSHEVLLTFESAGEIALDMPVMTLGEIRAAGEAAGAMDHSAPEGN